MEGEYAELIKCLKRLDGKKLDDLVHRLHDEESKRLIVCNVRIAVVV